MNIDKEIKNEKIDKDYEYQRMEKLATEVIEEYKKRCDELGYFPEPSQKTCLAYDNIKLLVLIKQKDKELETYKKIAKFMADFINMYTLSGEENQYCHRVIDCQEIGGSRSCIECIIDWAKREVENE